MYKNYIFDLYGTLVDLDVDEEKDELWKNLSLFYNYNGARYIQEELKEAYFYEVAQDIEKNHFTEYKDVKIENVFERMYKNKKIQPSLDLVDQTAKLFRILSTNEIHLYPGVKETLKYLKDNGKKIFLLSNSQRKFSIPELQYLKIINYFDGIYFSSDMMICKPDERFFYYLLERESLNTKESIMIGNDHRTDIKGANSVKMDSVYIYTNHSGKMPENLDCKYKILDGNFRKIKEI